MNAADDPEQEGYESFKTTLYGVFAVEGDGVPMAMFRSNLVADRYSADFDGCDTVVIPVSVDCAYRNQFATREE